MCSRTALAPAAPRWPSRNAAYWSDANYQRESLLDVAQWQQVFPFHHVWLISAGYCALKEAASMMSPPNPSIPEHQSTQFAAPHDDVRPSEDLWCNTSSLRYCWPSSTLTRSPFAASPKVVRSPGSLSLSAFHAFSSLASHNCFLAGSGARTMSSSSHIAAGSK